VLAASPVLVLALALLGFVGSIGAAAIALAIFFGAYFVGYEPYRALYTGTRTEPVRPPAGPPCSSAPMRARDGHFADRNAGGRGSAG
jgi:hypothetical protein